MVSEGDVDGMGAWVTFSSVPKTTKVEAELTLPSTSIGAIADLGTTYTEVNTAAGSPVETRGLAMHFVSLTRQVFGLLETGNDCFPVEITDVNELHFHHQNVTIINQSYLEIEVHIIKMFICQISWISLNIIACIFYFDKARLKHKISKTQHSKKS